MSIWMDYDALSPIFHVSSLGIHTTPSGPGPCLLSGSIIQVSYEDVWSCINSFNYKHVLFYS